MTARVINSCVINSCVLPLCVRWQVLRGDWGVNPSLASAAVLKSSSEGGGGADGGGLTHAATMGDEGTRTIQPPE